MVPRSKTSPKVPVVYEATSGGPNPKLMMTLKKACLPPLIEVLNNCAAEKAAVVEKFVRFTTWKLLNPYNSTKSLQIYKDAIELTSRRKVRFRRNKFKVRHKKCLLYKVVLVTDPFDHSGRIYVQPFKPQIYSKTNKIKFVPLTTVI